MYNSEKALNKKVLKKPERTNTVQSTEHGKSKAKSISSQYYE